MVQLPADGFEGVCKVSSFIKICTLHFAPSCGDAMVNMILTIRNLDNGTPSHLAPSCGDVIFDRMRMISNLDYGTHKCRGWSDGGKGRQNARCT